MSQMLDPFDFNLAEAPQAADTLPGASPIVEQRQADMSKLSVDLSTVISHYNRLEGIKSILSDMRLKMSVELRRKGKPAPLYDDLYMGQLGDVISLCESLQKWLPWSPHPSGAQREL